MLKTLCTEISSLKISSLESKEIMIVLLLISGSQLKQMLMNICSLDAVLQVMLLRKSLILKTLKRNMHLFVICLVWELFSIYFYWENLLSQEDNMMKFSVKIELVNLTFKELIIKLFQQKVNFLFNSALDLLRKML